MEIKRILGISLGRFTIEELTEVYRIDEDGRKISSLGFFRNEKIAKGFAHIQVDAAWHKTGKKFVLTDGKNGFVLGEPIEILDDEKAKLDIAKTARSKLTQEEAEALGLA